ncbi:MAG: fibronectin type III domain-containing protein, partial [Muribaculaceae bacterium]|nr:fibronectin type III domain-containing protein [Muribaculaceae bacterium]
PITQITEDFGMIYFKVCGGVDEILPVEAYEAKDITFDSFVASWSEAYKGCEYILSVFSKDESGEPVYVKGYEKRYVGTLSQVSVTGLEGSTIYYYRVSAYDPGFKIYSDYSNVVEFTTLPADDAGVGIVTENSAEVEYYNLQGVRVENPATGQILIMKKGNSTRKIKI